MGAYEDSVEAWRQARYRRLTAPDGWLALVGKHPLEKGTTRVALDGDDPTARADGPAEVAVRFDGTGATVVVAPGDERELTAAGFTLGTRKLELLQRGEEAYLRVKDSASRARTEFAGVPHYAVDPRWRIVARFEPFAEPRSVTLDYEGGASTTYAAPGAAVFDVGGRTFRLTLLQDPDQPRFYVLFKDATNRDTTYGAGRFMYPPLPEGDGDTVVLDFNQAFNPPCALTPWASCPLVPRENWLDLRVEAGEKQPEDH